MKRSNFTSFLFSIAFSLFALNLSFAQNSADCQDEINFSLGGNCDIAIPYEAFNTWAPSCLTITDADGNVVAAIAPAGTLPFEGKIKCYVTLDSVTMDTLISSKVTVYKLDAWKVDCDPGSGPDTILVDLSLLPAITETSGCNRDTFFTPEHLLVVPTLIDSGTVVLDISKAPDCAHIDSSLTSDGKLLFRDSVITYSIKTHTDKIMKVDTFSHTDPLRYVAGTTIVGGVQFVMGDTLIHKAKTETKVSKDCAIPSFADIFGKDVIGGSAKMTPGEYTYTAQTPDSLNICWGKINVEFKLWPIIEGRADTLACIEFTDFSRAVDYDYHPTTSEKLEDVCAWAEAVVRVDHTDPEPDETALRTDDRIAWLANNSVRHCHEYVISHEDRWIKNFDWICDTVFKVRDFYTERPGYKDGKKELKKILTDSLYVTPIQLNDVQFPLTVVMDCGVIDGVAPSHIAEYLYHAFKDWGDVDVIFGQNTVTSGYDLGKPCATFATQYNGFAVTADPGGALVGANATATNKNIWTKVFKYADYNNIGVGNAFPYVYRNVKTVDKGLKDKLDALAASGDLTGVGAADYTVGGGVRVPVHKLLCNIAATYLDLHPVAICEGEDKYFRKWTLVDWCTGTTRDTTQIIKFFDRFAPTIEKWEGVDAGKCDADDDNSKGQEQYYFGNLTDLASNAHVTKIPSGIPWLIQVDHLDCDGDGNTTEAALWIQDDCSDPAKSGYIYTRYEKVTNPWDCKITHKFPWLTLGKACSDDKHQFEVVNHDGETDGNVYQSGDDGKISWTHEGGVEYPFVRVTLWDDCGNECEYYYYLKGIDKIPPIVVLHDEIIVTLTADDEDFGSTDINTGGSGEEAGIAKIFCADVDAGSHDGSCGPILSCEVRRKGSSDDWADFIHFDCADLGEVPVEVQITDWSGNTAIGWMVVTVENKNGPFITCEDVTVDCDDPIAPEWVGYPHVFDICASPGLEYSDEYSVDDLCFTGYIKRTWSIPGSGVQCVQTITIDDNDDGDDNSNGFNPRSIHWPLHFTSENWFEFEARIGDFGMDDIIIKDYNDHGQCEDFVFHGDISADNAPNVRAVTYASFKKYASGSADDKASRKAFLEGCNMNDQFYCDIGDLNEPYWTDPVCGLVGKSYSDETFKFNDGVCFKVVRRWAIIDWCVYEPNEDSSDLDQDDGDNYLLVKDLCADKSYFKYGYGTVNVDGYYVWDQEIKIADDEQPVITAADDVTVEVGAGGKEDDSACDGEVTLTSTAVDFCGGSIVTGEDGTPHEGPELDWVISIFTVDADGKQTLYKTEVVKGGNEVGGGELFSDENQSSTASVTIEGSAGDHFLVKWRATDGCNNPTESEANGETAITEVWFKDVKAPVIFCIADLSTNAMSTDGTSVIWASDYVQAAADCDGDPAYVYFLDDEGNKVPSLTLTCDDIPGGVAATWEGRVYAFDEAGNYSFCEVSLRVSDSNDACPDDNTGASASITGQVRSRLSDMVESTQLSIQGDARMTGVDGIYAFDNMPIGGNYQLDAEKVDDYMNGVSTLDLVLIQKHILGLQLFESPYQVYAADINSDEGVSAIDLVELRKLILGIYSELPNNASWRFADASQTFNDILRPFPFAEVINVDFLVDNVNEDFVAVKVGDVSGNAIANSLQVQGRSNAELTFVANDQSFEAGSLVRVAISSDQFVDMNAFQFTLSHGGLEFQGVEGGAIPMTLENVAVHGSKLTAAWTSVEPVTSGNELFTLVFKSGVSGQLSDVLGLNSEITTAGTYNSDLERSDLVLAFNTDEGLVRDAEFALYQNEPNPFEAVTNIGFQLAEAGQASLTIFDVTGKTVAIERGHFARGYNEVTVSKSDLGASGVLYYQLESGEFTATRKMIVIE